MQRSDPFFKKLLYTLPNAQEPDGQGFKLINGVLYRQATSATQPYFRLCIPQEICRDIVHAIHHLHNMHFPAHTMQVLYSANFYTRGANSIIKTIYNSCSLCLLYSPKYTRSYSGRTRTFDQNNIVGEILYADIAYLHRDCDQKKFALIFTDRLTGYVVAYALQEITMKSTSPCIEEYLRHLPAPTYVCTDGGGEFDSLFTQILAHHNIKHRTNIPTRSQVQGTVG